MAATLSNKSIEALAIRAALGNNGGRWAEHYTADQQEHWRNWVCDFEKRVTEALARPT